MLINFKDKTISKKSKTFVIGEIGLNHDGNLTECKKLIDCAKKSGFDAVKLQIANPYESYHPNTKSFSFFKKYSLKEDDIKKAVSYAKKRKIIIFSTFGDISSLRLQDKFNFPIIKISSGLITNLPLIKRIAEKRKPIILSTGMSYIKDIVEAVKVIKKNNKKNLVLLACTSLYPCEDKYINLSKIKSLQKKFNLTVGYSDHSKDNFSSIASVIMGAKVIEKHITIKKKNYGDHRFAADKKEMKDMIKGIRRAEIIKGLGYILPDKKEIKLRDQIMRKIVTKKRILKGELFSLKNISLMRHKIKLNNSLYAKDFDIILGKKNKKEINKFQILTKKIFKYESKYHSSSTSRFSSSPK